MHVQIRQITSFTSLALLLDLHDFFSEYRHININIPYMHVTNINIPRIHMKSLSPIFVNFPFSVSEWEFSMNSSCYITLQESFNTYFTSSHIAPAVSIHTNLLCKLNKISWGQQKSEVTSQRRFYMPLW